MTLEISQKDRMTSGRLYYAVKDPELIAGRKACRSLCNEYNSTTEDEWDKRTGILQKLLKSIDVESPPYIEPPFTCDYGYNIVLGKGVYLNFGCILLDGNTIEIGDDTLLGPNVQFYPPGHPLDAEVRDGLRGPEYAQPISIGKNCWIGGSAIFLGGVTVGDCVVVGAGAVVTKDVPAWTVVAGNPAKIIRRIQPGDKSPREIS